MSPQRKLTAKQVASVQQDLRRGMTQREAARKYSMSQGTISNVARGVYFKKNKYLYAIEKPSIVIVNDPSEWGYRKGAIFTHTEVEQMLKFNSFTDGTKLEIRSNRGNIKKGSYTIVVTSEMVEDD